MTYEKITEAERDALFITMPDGSTVSTIAPDEEVVRLDTGSLVAVSCQAARAEFSQGRVITAMARWLDAEGGTEIDYNGARVFVEYRHHASVHQIALHSEPTVRRELLLLVMGEPPTEIAGEPLIQWPAEVRANASIRNAIAAATDEGPDFNIGDLL